MSPATLSRRLLPWLFVLALLWGQAAAFAHACSHLGAHDAGLPDAPCELCVAQASLGGAIPGKPFIPAAEATPDRVPVAAVLPPARGVVRHAPARAPPLSA
jgi:hypothetical protein